MGVSVTVFCLLLLSCVANSGDDLAQQFFRQRKMLPFMGLALLNVNMALQTSLACQQNSHDEGSYQA